MKKTTVYKLENSTNLSDWKLEGFGAIEITETGEIIISTRRVAGNKKATNVWLKDIELPNNFEISFDFRSNSENGNTMIIFNAMPLKLEKLWDDPREDAAYCDLASYSKMQAYTVGFHRAAYDRPSVLRKIGGMVPKRWGDAPWPSPEWQEMDAITTINSGVEALSISDKGMTQNFRLVKFENRITFYCNDIIVHDCFDELQYPYCDKVLVGGRMAFRNFVGPAEDFYSNFVISELTD